LRHVDGDDDDFPRPPQQGEVCVRARYDCDDTDPLINPDSPEVCGDSGLDDEDCDDFANCEDEECWAGQTPQCDEQCDNDGDGHYKETCGGDDCDDQCENCFPGFGQPPLGTTGEAWGSNSCDDGDDNDCDGNDKIDCFDPDCAEMEHCMPTPTPTPTPTPEPYECDPTGYEQEWCEYVLCNEWDPWLCDCVPGPPGECGSPQAGPCCSPIVIDTVGNGFDLTNAGNGVLFDLNGDGSINSRLAWTSIDSDDAWLALDRNGNGLIEKGAELFGNFTDQPASTHRNGFEALAVFDEPQNGGDGNGRIDAQDAVFSQLRLWRDFNHNGISEINELHPLLSLGVAAIDLDYRRSRRRDQHGNRFRYRAKVRDVQGTQVGRWAWDVFLRSESLEARRNIFIQPQVTFSVVKTSCDTE
jgi:hypothetical protein